MSTTGYHLLDSVTDQVILFFGLIAAFVAGGAVIWLILRRAGSSDDAVASTLRESLQQIEAKLQEFEVAREKSHAGLKEQVASLATSELQLQKETSRLASALKNPGVRGRWGEMQLRRVVELAGMAEHCDFTEQILGEGDNRRMRPDMIVNLPNSRRIVIDAKTPLQAYLESSEAVDETVRVAKRKEHARQVRAQIVRLSAKSYWDQFAEAPEFAVLFLPGESFFSAALTEEPELLEYGADRKVILATPTTLIALLKAVAYGWRQQRAAARAEEIREIGSELYERLQAMSTEMSALGVQMERAVQAYNRTLGAWESKAVPAAKRLHELGAGGSEELEAARYADSPVRLPK